MVHTSSTSADRETETRKGTKEEICLALAFGQISLDQKGQSAFSGAAANSSGTMASGEDAQAGEVQHHFHLSKSVDELCVIKGMGRPPSQEKTAAACVEGHMWM